MTVIAGFLTSSIKYKSRKEGKARQIRISAGRIVQIVSICWASSVLREENFLDRSASMAYPTVVIISIRITIA